MQCTEVRFFRFFSDGFITATLVTYITGFFYSFNLRITVDSYRESVSLIQDPTDRLHHDSSMPAHLISRSVRIYIENFLLESCFHQNPFPVFSKYSNYNIWDEGQNKKEKDKDPNIKAGEEDQRHIHHVSDDFIDKVEGVTH